MRRCMKTAGERALGRILNVLEPVGVADVGNSEHLAAWSEATVEVLLAETRPVSVAGRIV